MAKGAETSRLRLGLNAETGDQVLMLGSERDSMTEATVDNLMEKLRQGKEDSRAVKIALKTIGTIYKQYNTVGKPLDPGNLKTIPEGAPVPEGVIDDEAA